MFLFIKCFAFASCFSLVQSESSNTDHVVNLDETECSEYSSPPHGKRKRKKNGLWLVFSAL